MQQGSPGREEVEEEVILVMMTLAGGCLWRITGFRAFASGIEDKEASVMNGRATRKHSGLDSAHVI